MPRRDGTGPMGQGARTGRGLGYCNYTMPARGFGKGYGQGFNCYGNRQRGGVLNQQSNYDINQPNKEWLERQKEMLESQLNYINNQLSDK